MNCTTLGVGRAFRRGLEKVLVQGKGSPQACAGQDAMAVPYGLAIYHSYLRCPTGVVRDGF